MQAQQGTFRNLLWMTTCAWCAPARSMIGMRSSYDPPAWASSLVSTLESSYTNAKHSEMSMSSHAL